MCSAFDKPDCFDTMKKFYERVQRIKDVDFPLVLVVRTKSDLVKSEHLYLHDIYTWVKSIQSCFISTSARAGINVNVPFQLAYEGAMRQRYLDPTRVRKKAAD